jgi:osmotically-inducible protein OsmY
MKNKKILALLLLSCFGLQGCLPAVFVAGAAAGGSIIYDHRSTKTMVEDKDILLKAQSALRNNQEVGTRCRVVATAFNHVLLLVGQAPTPELRARAENAVKDIDKVKLLRNEVAISYPINISTQSRDTWLTTKVKSILLAQKGLNSTQVKVVTEDSTVYLLGLVTRGQADLVVEKVRDIDGVKKVVKVFEYIN